MTFFCRKLGKPRTSWRASAVCPTAGGGNLFSPHEPSPLRATAKNARRLAPRSGSVASNGHCCRHHHRQRHFPCASRNDAGRGLLRPGLSRLDRRWAALALRRNDLRRTRRDAALCRRRIRLPARCLRRYNCFSLHVDLVCCRQAGLDCGRHHWAGAHAWLLPCFPLAERRPSWPHSAALVAGVRDRRHLVHHRTELPRHQEGRRLPARVHDAQSNSDPDCCRPVLRRGVRLSLQLHHHAATCRWRPHGIHGSAHRHALGL